MVSLAAVYAGLLGIFFAQLERLLYNQFIVQDNVDSILAAVASCSIEDE